MKLMKPSWPLNLVEPPGSNSFIVVWEWLLHIRSKSMNYTAAVVQKDSYVCSMVGSHRSGLPFSSMVGL